MFSQPIQDGTPSKSNSIARSDKALVPAAMLALAAACMGITAFSYLYNIDLFSRDHVRLLVEKGTLKYSRDDVRTMHDLGMSPREFSDSVGVDLLLLRDPSSIRKTPMPLSLDIYREKTITRYVYQLSMWLPSAVLLAGAWLPIAAFLKRKNRRKMKVCIYCAYPLATPTRSDCSECGLSQ